MLRLLSGVVFVSSNSFSPSFYQQKLLTVFPILFANRRGQGASRGSVCLAEHSPETSVTHNPCTRPARWEISMLISPGSRCCLLINTTFKGHVSEMKQSRDSTHIYRRTCWALQGHCLVTYMAAISRWLFASFFYHQ